jgi:hypothetical protein
MVAIEVRTRPGCFAELQLGAHGPPVDGGRQLVRTGVVHPIPVPFMDQRELQKGWIAQRAAVDL